MGNGLLITVSIGLAAGGVLLIVAVRAGRDKPRRMWAWVLALVLLATSVMMRLAIMIGVSQSGDLSNAIPVAVGTAAVIVALVAAIWRPVWTGWMLLASAALIPPLLWIAQLVIGENPEQMIPAAALFATYSIPIAIISGLLLLAGSTHTGDLTLR